MKPVTGSLNTAVKFIGDTKVGSGCAAAWLMVTVGGIRGVQQTRCEIVTSSILQPVAATLLSEPIRNLNLTFCPAAAGGKVTVDVKNEPAVPVQAIRPPIGLPNEELIVPL